MQLLGRGGGDNVRPLSRMISFFVLLDRSPPPPRLLAGRIWLMKQDAREALFLTFVFGSLWAGRPPKFKSASVLLLARLSGGGFGALLLLLIFFPVVGSQIMPLIITPLTTVSFLTLRAVSTLWSWFSYVLGVEGRAKIFDDGVSEEGGRLTQRLRRRKKKGTREKKRKREIDTEQKYTTWWEKKYFRNENKECIKH